jgi:hypothetical protein
VSAAAATVDLNIPLGEILARIRTSAIYLHELQKFSVVKQRTI